MHLIYKKNLICYRKFFPNERKQCEIIWEPVYDEYGRLGYRLRKDRTDEMENESLMRFGKNKKEPKINEKEVAGRRCGKT